MNANRENPKIEYPKEGDNMQNIQKVISSNIPNLSANSIQAPVNQNTSKNINKSLDQGKQSKYNPKVISTESKDIKQKKKIPSTQSSKKRLIYKNKSSDNLFHQCGPIRVSRREELGIIKDMNERFSQYQSNKMKKREILQKKILEEEMREAHFHPRINANCSVDTSEIKKENFLQRNNKFVENKNNKSQKNMNEKKKKELDYLSPRFRKKKKLSDIQQSISSLMDWEEAKNISVEMERAECRKKEMEFCTFKPNLNKKSMQMVKNKTNYGKDYRVQEVKPKIKLSGVLSKIQISRRAKSKAKQYAIVVNPKKTIKVIHHS